MKIICLNHGSEPFGRFIDRSAISPIRVTQSGMTPYGPPKTRSLPGCTSRAEPICLRFPEAQGPVPEADRFGKVSVHACGKTALQVPLHRVSGQGDHSLVKRYACLPSPKQADRLKSIEDRHLHVHQHQVKAGAFKRIQCFASILD